ncbi:MAG: LuxR family transcriptional regulator [Nocardioidaceae bacterium]|nr:LuxR family transcriptional regulator [Nocardioidaceae bacterium]
MTQLATTTDPVARSNLWSARWFYDFALLGAPAGEDFCIEMLDNPTVAESPQTRAFVELTRVFVGPTTRLPAQQIDDDPSEQDLSDYVFLGLALAERHMSHGDLAQAWDVSDRAQKHTRSSMAVSWMRQTQHRSLAFQGDLEGARDSALALLDRAERLDHGAVRLITHGSLAFSYAYMAQLAHFEKHLAVCREARPQTVHDEGSQVLAAYGLHALGRHSEAADLMLRAAGGATLHRLQYVDRPYAYEMLTNAAIADGDLVAATLWAEKCATLDGPPVVTAAVQRTQSSLLTALGLHEESARAAQSAWVSSESSGGLVDAARALVMAAAARGHAGDARDAHESLRWVVSFIQASGAHAIRGSMAEKMRELGISERLRGRGWDALTLREQEVAMLAATGLTSSAIAAELYVSESTVKAHLRAVYAVLGVESRIVLAQRYHPARAPGERPAIAKLLTSRQVEVADLVAAGNRNSAIAAKLAISTKTVEKHLGDIYAKLGIRSRAALAARWS